MFKFNLALSIVLATFLPFSGAAIASAGSQFPVGGVPYPNCSSPFYPDFVTNVFQLDIPAYKVINATGSFFNGEWLAGPLFNFTGQDNVPGAMRTGNLSGVVFPEVLTYYELSRDGAKLDMQWTGTAPVVSIGPSLTTLESWVTEFEIHSICSGNATLMVFYGAQCTNQVIGIESFWIQTRQLAVSGLAQTLGANEYFGTCPPLIN